MPTSNDFSDFRFAPQQDDYKQSSMEQKDRSALMKDNEPMLPEVGQGNYPRIFDREAGSEPVSPDLYIDRVYKDVSATGPGQSYTSTERQSVSGEYGFTDQPNLNGVFVSDNMVPTPSRSMQFNSDKTGDPIELLNQTRADVDAHSNLNRAYGLNMPVAGLGITPWLRDSLADPSQDEPGNAMPSSNLGIPFGGK